MHKLTSTQLLCELRPTCPAGQPKWLGQSIHSVHQKECAKLFLSIYYIVPPLQGKPKSVKPVPRLFPKDSRSKHCGKRQDSSSLAKGQLALNPDRFQGTIQPRVRQYEGTVGFLERDLEDNSDEDSWVPGDKNHAFLKMIPKGVPGFLKTIPTTVPKDPKAHS